MSDGSGAGRGGAGAEPAVEAPEAPTFSLDELNRCKGVMLGGGAFGKVYAINGFPGLAVKEIWLKGQPDRLVEITKFELEALSQFSHPGVLKYHQVIEDGDFFYVVMDRYDRDLQHFIADHARTRRSIPRELMLSIVRQLADALAYVHNPAKVDANGNLLPAVVHRDLKPANVLMSRDGERIVLADFGLCKDVLRNGRTFAGSPAYMAPEVFIHRKTSRASDIWALGVITYELAALDLPSFSRKWEPEDAEKYFVPEWKPDLSPVKDDFIKGILEKIFVLDPEERPTAGELRAFLWALNASDTEAKLHISELEAALKDAHTKNISLEEGLQTRLTEINSLKDTVATQAAELNFLRESLKKLAAQDPSWTPLMCAAAAGDIEAVKKHLSKKGKKDNRKDMALVLAARAGHKDVVELLDPTDKNGVTALMRAADRNDVEAVRALIPLQKGKKMMGDVTINGWAIHGGTALMIAAACGHAEAVRLLVEHEGGMQDADGRTALMWAARADHPGCVGLLLEREGGMQDSYGWTALMWAAYKGHTECARLLAEKEKDMKTTRRWCGCPPGTTALDIARWKGHTAIASILSG